ncbi:MAG: restriction endonuclease subunit S [Parcubacteria group bacterium]|nr:restriction endonuclease subunit S [Parcubacteria group bacterium]
MTNTDTKTIPNGWKETTLGEVASLVKDAWKPGDEDTNYIGLEHITEKELTLNGVGRSIALESNKFRFCAGDVLFGKLRPYFRKVVVPNFDGVCSTDIWVLRANEGFDQKFLFYFMANPVLVDKTMGANTGTHMPRADWGYLANTEWNTPSIPEQRAIAAVLSSLDGKIELLREENKTLEAIAQAMFKEWFVNFNFPNADGKPYKTFGGKMVDSELGEIPAGWSVGRFTDVSSILGGGTPKTDVPKYWNGDIPFFTPKDARDDVYCLGTEKTITKEGFDDCNSRMYPKNTVFITARGTVGKCALASRDMAMNQSCYALVGKDTSNLFVYLATKDLLETFLKRATGAVFDAITTETFSSLDMVIPPEQKVKDFTEIIEPMFNKVLSNSLSVQTLSASRDALLPKLMKGEIRVGI